MGNQNLYVIPDAGTLRTVVDGLLIIRRRKHEYTPMLARLSGQEIVAATDKRQGSKFLPRWTLDYLCNWIEITVEKAKWTLELQEPNPLVIRLEEEVGLFNGERVHTICIRSDGRQIHAYPIKDQP